jgi:integrase
MRALGAEYPSQVTNEKLDAWIKSRGETVGRATINRDLNVARKMLRWASDPDQGLCDENALVRRKNLREPRRTQRRTLPSPAEIAATVKRLERMDESGAALTIAAGSVSGMRLDQLRHVTPDDVTARGVHVMPEAGAANVAWTDKGYDARLIPLAPEAVAVMRAFVTWRTAGRGGKGKRPGVSDTWIAEKIDEATKGTKLPRFRMHDLRRTFATEAVRAGVPITVVSKWLGHKDIATTERYVGIYRSDAEVTAPVTRVASALSSSAVRRLHAVPSTSKKRSQAR